MNSLIWFHSELGKKISKWIYNHLVQHFFTLIFKRKKIVVHTHALFLSLSASFSAYSALCLWHNIMNRALFSLYSLLSIFFLPNFFVHCIEIRLFVCCTLLRLHTLKSLLFVQGDDAIQNVVFSDRWKYARPQSSVLASRIQCALANVLLPLASIHFCIIYKRVFY